MLLLDSTHFALWHEAAHLSCYTLPSFDIALIHFWKGGQVEPLPPGIPGAPDLAPVRGFIPTRLLDVVGRIGWSSAKLHLSPTINGLLSQPPFHQTMSIWSINFGSFPSIYLCQYNSVSLSPISCNKVSSKSSPKARATSSFPIQQPRWLQV